MEEDKRIKIKCRCGREESFDLRSEDMNWEIVETDEREMGVELTHEALLCYTCETCHDTCTIYLRVWEYPEGVYNDEEIEVEGGELVKSCSVGDLVL